MIIRRLVLGIFTLVLLTGCKTTFKSNWKNFNAYYNTYYNAKQSYESGLQKNLNQPREYNPLQPIRVHPKPVNAGAQDFNKAIEKGADVLRRYDDTKWVDDAIGLIGRSYYYRQEYFSADQKFKELFVTTQNPEMQQKSILWQGRVLLDMELHNEGVAFLSEQLTLQDEIWTDAYKAELKALLAQHYVQLENWQVAANELAEALPDLRKKEYRERGYFLLGQIYEELGNTEAAYEAYDEVKNHYVEYRIQYLSQRKKAEVARRLGRNDVAFSIFRNMVRDDKNLEYKAELDFELARTEHERGNYEKAEKLYNDVLHRNLRQPAPEIAARAYNGLAEIYRYQYNDFSMAAAYYDSASQRNVPAEKLPEDFQAGELAQSFGNYVRIKKDIALQDSLIRLGRMSPQEFDSALTKLKEKKLNELRKLREQQERQQNQMVTVNQQEEGQEAANMSNGFLNENNLVQQQTTKQQFYALWGNRPLADNWRVEELIDYSNIQSDEDEAGGPQDSEQSEIARIQIDLSPIPFTKQEQDSVQKIIAANQYELGNLFFISLNLPDSAIHYFQKAIENPSKDNINTVSLYSLSELHAINQNQERAQFYAKRLVDEYPNTEYARRVSENFGIPLNQDENDSVNVVRKYKTIAENDSMPLLSKGQKLKDFALQNNTERIAPQALFEAIQTYMKAGKDEEKYQENIQRWITQKEDWRDKRQEFQVKQDSARSSLNDTTITDEQWEYFQAMVDSTLQEPDFDAFFPYEGATWDSARAAIDTFLVVFNTSLLKSKVTRLKNELAVPVDEEEVQLQEENSENQTAPPSTTTEGYLSCQELDIELEIRGGIQSFMDNLSFSTTPEIAEIQYLFKVNQRGIMENYTLQTDSVSQEVVRTFEQALADITFEPVLNEGQAVAVECPITFPLRR